MMRPSVVRRGGELLVLVRPMASVASAGVNESMTEPNAVLPFDKIPGPRSLPIIKSGWIFIPGIGPYDVNKLHDAYLDMNKRYGNVVRFDIPGTKGVLAFDPKDVATVLRNEGEFPHHPGIEPLRAVRANYSTGGITTLNGKPWYELRSKIQPHMLRVNLVQNHFGKMEEVTEDMIRRIRHLMKTGNGETKDFIKDLQVWAIETVSYIALNKRLHCLKENIDVNSDSYRMKEAAIEVFRGLSETVFGTQMWRFFATPSWTRLCKAHATFAELGLKHINEVLETVKTKTPDDDLTFLEDFLTRKNVKPEDAVIMALDLLLAGVDTTSNATGFLLYDLARHPEKQEKLYQEIKGVLTKEKQTMTNATVEAMPYLRACVKESLRLHPIVVGTARILDKDIQLSNYVIPAKTYILLCAMAMSLQHCNFKNPNEYIPERWLRENKETSNHYPYSYLPFGHGTRMCLGRRIAQNEMYTLTSRLIQNFRVEYHHEEIHLRTGLTSTPSLPLKYRFVERTV